MSAEISVVRARTDDIATLADLQWRWRVEEWSGARAVDRAAFATAMRDWFAEHSESHRPFIARSDGSVVGMAWLAAIERVVTPAQLTRRDGLVESVYVVPDARNRGVGSALLGRVIDEARQLGFGYLLVRPSDRSFPLYRRHGFRGDGEFLSLRFTSDGEQVP